MILSLIAMTLIEPGDEVLYPDPGFPIYVSLIRMLGGIPVTYGLRQQNGFQPDVDEIVCKITPRTKLLIINSPGNPTGTVISGRVQQELAALAIKHDLWVISDEIYARMVYDIAYTSISVLPGMSERTIIVDGFSKSFAMTGWRLGYAVVPEQLLESLRLLIVNTYTCTSEFIQHAGIEALADSAGAVDRMVAQFHDRRKTVYRGPQPHFRLSLQPARWGVLCLGEYRTDRNERSQPLEHVAGRGRGCWYQWRRFWRERKQFSSILLCVLHRAPAGGGGTNREDIASMAEEEQERRGLKL